MDHQAWTRLRQAKASAPRAPARVATIVLFSIGLAGLAWAFLPSTADRTLSQDALAERTATFAQAGPFHLPPVTPAESGDARRTMQLSAEQDRQLQSDLARKAIELVWLELWDDMDIDGDVVSVESAGFRQTVQLARGRARLAIPRPPDGRVTVRGIRDGGGGITVAAAAASGPVKLPIMAVGQSISVPVR